MKLTIDKSGNNITVQIVAKGGQNPITVNLTQSQLDGFLKTLDMLRPMDTVKMTLELK